VDCAVEISSGAIIQIVRIMKTVSAIQKLIVGCACARARKHIHTQTTW
jgi:hypothetical protein